MTKSKIIFVILITLVISTAIIILPWAFICDLKEAITLGATILSGLAGAGTIIVALTVYEDIIGKKILEKKFDTVNSFLEEIKTLRIQVVFYENYNLNGFSVLHFEKDTKFISNSNFNNTDNFKVAFSSDNYYLAMDRLFKLTNSIHMPTELKNELQFLSPPVMTMVKKNSSSQIAYIIINDKLELANIESMTWMEFMNQPLTLKNYLDKIGDIIKSMEAWLQTNSKSKIRLNL